MLSDRGIRQAVAEGRITIKPYNVTQEGTNTYNITTDRIHRVKNTESFNTFRKDPEITHKKVEKFIERECDRDYDGILLPDQLYIGVSKERFGGSISYDFASRSSAARYGINTRLRFRPKAGSQTHLYYSIQTDSTTVQMPLGMQLSHLILDIGKPISDEEIKALIRSGEFNIKNREFELEAFPDGVMLRLSNTIKRYKGKTMVWNKSTDDCFDIVDIEKSGKIDPKHPQIGKVYFLEPNVFYMGETYEELQMPVDHAGMLCDLDYDWLLHLGLGSIHSNAPVFAANSGPKHVYEMRYKNGFYIWPGRPTSKLQLHKLDQIPEKLYGARPTDKYLGQSGVQTSLSQKDMQKEADGAD